MRKRPGRFYLDRVDRAVVGARDLDGHRGYDRGTNTVAAARAPTKRTERGAADFGCPHGVRHHVLFVVAISWYRWSRSSMMSVVR